MYNWGPGTPWQENVTLLITFFGPIYLAWQTDSLTGIFRYKNNVLFLETGLSIELGEFSWFRNWDGIEWIIVNRAFALCMKKGL